MTETESPSSDLGVPTAVERDQPSRRGNLRSFSALSPRSRVWPALTLAAVLVGCALRFLRWFDNPALWLDESYLAINLVDKSLTDIFGTLHLNQSAPPGFLGIEKLAELTLGDGEWSLRLFPLVASLASVVLFGYVAIRLLSPPAAALAAVLFATLEPLLLRSAEVKHYSTDVAVTTLLLALYVWATLPGAKRGPARVIVFGAAGSAALFLSFPAAFTFAALIAALFVHVLASRARDKLIATAAVAGLAILSVATVYLMAAPNLTRVSSSIFGEGEGEGGGGLSVGRLGTVENAWWMFVNPGGFENETNSLAAVLALLGLFALARAKRFELLVMLGGPLALAGIADLVDKYPLGGRFSMFLVPLLVLLIVHGAETLVSWSRHPVVVSAGLAAFLALSPVSIALYHVLERPARSDVKPVLREVAEQWRDGDTLYVYPGSQYQLRYYSSCSDCSPSRNDFPWPTRIAPPGEPGDQTAPTLESVPPEVVIGSMTNPAAPLSDLEQLRGASRIWLLFSTSPVAHDGLDDEALLRHELEKQATQIVVVRARGAEAYLYERAR